MKEKKRMNSKLLTRFSAHPICIALCVVVLISEASSQTFTRVTDISNPVVTDSVESGGGTWLDVNKDGFLDLFVSNGNLSNINNSLYLNDTKGNFIKVKTGSVVTDGGSSIGSTAGDYNADGSPDLFVTNRQNFGNFLYQGKGDTALLKIASGLPVTDIANSNSSSWVDIDNDGDLDLFTVNFQGNNYLYINSGPPSFTFSRIDTGAIVTDGNNFSIVGSWSDYNNDRRPDFFIGNAGTQNDHIFTNKGGGAFSVTTLSDAKATLGASWGDYDNDGDLDLFAASFLNQKSYLYRNSGPPAYTFTRIDTGIVSNDAGNSVGSFWFDADNDGDLDLYVANDGQNNFLYLNSGYPDHAFTKVTSGAVVSEGGNSFGTAGADYDNDGDVDIFVANRLNQKNFLYTNDGNGHSWLTVMLKGTVTNTSAIGTKVRVKATINGRSVWQMQEVQAQSGYNSQNLRLHFGLRDAAVIDSIKIEWQSGTDQYAVNLPVNQHRTFEETNGPTEVRSSEKNLPGTFQLFQNYPNPFNPSTVIAYSIPKPASVTLTVFDALGRNVGTLVDQYQQAGTYQVRLSAVQLMNSSGVYFYSITAGTFTDVKKLILLR